MRIKRFNELHTGVESGPEDANFQHQQAGSDLPRSPQVTFLDTNINTKIDDLNQLKEGDIILYQGSKVKVMNTGEFVIRVMSLETNKTFLINQGQCQQFGINLISSVD